MKILSADYVRDTTALANSFDRISTRIRRAVEAASDQGLSVAFIPFGVVSNTVAVRVVDALKTEGYHCDFGTETLPVSRDGHPFTQRTLIVRW